MSTKVTKQTRVKVIGKNEYGELGDNSISKSHLSLVDGEINNLSTKITDILCGDEYSIYCEDEYENIWIAGYNDTGLCANGQCERYENSGFHQLKFFKNNDIKLKKICANPCALSTFWITASGQVYANGRNTHNQLGIEDDDENKSIPVLIEGLKDMNIIDIQCNGDYALALCSNISPDTSIIIKHWSRKANIEIPRVIVNIIINLYNMNKVLSCGQSSEGGLGHGDITKIKKWTEIERLKDKHIHSIRTGLDHSYFLDSTGIVYVCGWNHKGQLGINTRGKSIINITKIEYFVKNNIKIRDIISSSIAVMMTDYDGRVWSFGDDVHEPKELIMFRDCNVNQIKCGRYHVYLRCDNDSHYLWGRNDFNQCLIDDDEHEEEVASPHLLNLKDGMEILGVFLGYDNTKIIVRS